MNRLALKVHASRRGTIFFLRCQRRGAVNDEAKPVKRRPIKAAFTEVQLEDGYDPKQREERDIGASDQESIGLKKNRNADRHQPEKTGEKPAKDDAMGAILSRRP
ncbi:hypothetical protein F2Q69_00051661 [Brassica cretica]|uniref:Uncharacterized protein n=1 Tax=Brassica cretica TaxID=69181 RepID=A0A8S9PKZ0_BRACR|nr:hypothetical protein F2Q69_00051661 [Brassica cretica]